MDENGLFIDDFPSYKPPFMVGIFHGYVSHNQMVYITHHNPYKSINNYNQMVSITITPLNNQMALFESPHFPQEVDLMELPSNARSELWRRHRAVGAHRVSE